MLRYLALLMFAFVALPAAAQSAFTSDRISVEVRGQGPDVVLIPGLSSHPQVWESTIQALPGYRYHLVHVAGFAGKAPEANASGPVLVPVSEEIARYISEARLDRPAIVGHSMGGSWALLVAGRNPGLVSRVMVVDMLPFIGAMFGGPNATAEGLRPIAEQIRAGMASATPEARRAQIEQMIAGMIRTEALRPRAIEQSLTSHPPTSAQGFHDLVVTDLRPEVARLGVPLTVLYTDPAGAPLTPAQIDQFYQASYAGARQVVVRRVPESAHFIMFDAPETFQRELREFLTRD